MTRRWVGLALPVLAGWLWAAEARSQGEALSAAHSAVEPEYADGAAAEARLLTNIRQLTFAGRRAGEGYFSRDGRRMVFQSERDSGNPFFQIYLLDLATGDLERVSPGRGKTTCAWIHPQGNRVLFASTHEDPMALEKQRQELEFRASGEVRRYAWDFDEHFDLFEYDVESREYRNITSTLGYDAEGSWSPDGRMIVFASNRRAYAEPLSERERALLERDPSSLVDIYVMDNEGSAPRRMTDALGYDGGPFFSPSGDRVCWRRFSEDGSRAEIMTAALDGSDVRQLTHLGAMSWAPYYHPSGEYLIFTTNRHGFSNFELYLVDVRGQHDPVRVTFTEGFDGLPVFSPDGAKLAWTTNRTANKQSQIFLADWNHAAAQRLLGLEDVPTTHATGAAAAAAAAAAERSVAACDPQDVLRHVDYLCRKELEGRLTGTVGERLATAYVAAAMSRLGLEGAGDAGSFFQEFEFTAGARLGSRNSLEAGDQTYQVDQDWRPLAFSATGQFEAAPLVFAGYGIVAAAANGEEEYDSYVHLDVRDKWVLVFRYLPEEISPRRRQHLSAYSSLRYKAMAARDRGARGLFIVSGPNSAAKDPLVPMQLDGSLSGSSIPVISIRDEVARAWLARSGKDLKDLQDRLDTGDPMAGFTVEELHPRLRVDIEVVRRTGRNVLGRLAAAQNPAGEYIVVGAHVDHLGKGASSNSLARSDEKNGIHFGADDNASGVAAMLEAAEYLVAESRQGRLNARRDLLFAAWSGEELGLLGSSHFLKSSSAPSSGRVDDSSKNSVHPAQPARHPSIVACLNMDMVGRLRDKLLLQGAGSSTFWREEVERRNVPLGLPITLSDDSYLPTDASAFFLRGVPILSAFTGSHEEYHTPRDTPHTLNYEGAARVAQFMALVAASLATREDVPDFVPAAPSGEAPRRARLRAYLGTIPDYAEEGEGGVALAGVAEGGPAATAGMRGGDVIVELAGRKIENIYDYTYAIEGLKIGQKVEIKVRRGGDVLTLEVIPGSRD